VQARRILAALGLSLLLAGCSGGKTAGGSAPGGMAAAGPAAGNATLPLPAWAVGDAWTYTFNGAPTSYIVSGQTATDWVMDTDSDERAFADAQDDVSRLGPQRKADLAGSQGDERVEFFHWPLAAGATWAARWDHADVRITVLGIDGGVAHLQAVPAAGGKPVYDYTYDAKAGWFGELHHYDGNGTELVGLKLTEAKHGWTGKVLRYGLKSLYSRQGNDSAADAAQLQPDATATDLWFSYTLACTGAAGFTIALTDSMGDADLAEGPCAAVTHQAPRTGQMDQPWRLVYSLGGQTASYSITVLQRTRTEVQVPSA